MKLLRLPLHSLCAKSDAEADGVKSDRRSEATFTERRFGWAAIARDVSTAVCVERWLSETDAGRDESLSRSSNPGSESDDIKNPQKTDKHRWRVGVELTMVILWWLSPPSCFVLFSFCRLAVCSPRYSSSLLTMWQSRTLCVVCLPEKACLFSVLCHTGTCNCGSGGRFHQCNSTESARTRV